MKALSSKIGPLLCSLCVLCALCVLCDKALALDREAFTFTKYDLDVRIEPDQQRLGVRGKLTVRNDSTTPQADLALQVSSSLDWRSIRIAGKPAQFVTHEYTSDVDHTGALSEAVVSLPHDIPPKSTLEIEIGYEGTIPLDVTRLTRIGVPEDKAKHTDWDEIGKSFSAVRGIGYVVWYPVATEAASLSDGNSVAETIGRWKAREAQAELKAKLTNSGEGVPTLLLCNGEGSQQAQERMSKHFANTTECRYPTLGMTVPLFAIGSYSGLDKPPVNISYLADHKSGAENYALAANLAAPLVKEWFGGSQPATDIRRAEVIELADPDAAPFESGTMLLTPLVDSDSRLYLLRAVHQLTHAAFPSPRPWIYEGLAHFAQSLEREQQNGRHAAIDFMGQHRAAIVDTEKAIAAEHSQTTAAGESLINTGIEEFYRSKAMYVWWMLRDMVGDDALKKALAAYRADDDKETAYIQHLIEAQSKRDLEWFFDEWVYRDHGLPDFHVESAYPRSTVDGHSVVTITIENLGDAGAEVPVSLRFDGGEATKRLEVRAKSKAVLRLEATGTPQEIRINDGSVPESDLANDSYKIEVKP